MTDGLKAKPIQTHLVYIANLKHCNMTITTTLKLHVQALGFHCILILMPKPNPANPYHCDRPMRRNGKQAKSGAVQYRCICGFTCTDGDRPAHRPLLSDAPLTQVERNRRYRAKKKAEKC